MQCPSCGNEVKDNIQHLDCCEDCGFPFSCDISYLYAPPTPIDHLRWHRLTLLLGAILFIFIESFSGLLAWRSAVYEGYIAKVVDQLHPATETFGMKVTGEAQLVYRVWLALDYIRFHDYDLYKAICTRIPEIEVSSRNDFYYVGKTRMEIAPIGAFIRLPQGKILIKRATAVGRDENVVYDRTIIELAAVILHEYDHARRYDEGLSSSGADEEIAVEQWVLQFLDHAGAPPGLLESKREYLLHPNAHKYRAWYNWQ